MYEGGGVMKSSLCGRMSIHLCTRAARAARTIVAKIYSCSEVVAVACLVYPQRQQSAMVRQRRGREVVVFVEYNCPLLLIKFFKYNC